ncbi:YpiB family protein [Staphylococcus hyicus]|uniref:YpiB family protein n=1 Tax=Staphylococcus hyicus TaxID=1284 RepID=UPI001F48ED53|nr:YpiB family protein [Staphylococcus hyicus]MCE5152988.1 YpiB family protein [Staphylococcus hyicus]
MFEVPIDQDKAHLLDYLLFQYQFKSRISVWILNYLKSDIHHLRRVHFVDCIINTHNTLEISIENSVYPAIRLTMHGTSYVNSNEIFTRIIHDTAPIDLKIHFSHTTYRDLRLDHMILHQLLTSHHDQSYLNDASLIHLTRDARQHLIRIIDSQIDLSLQMKDQSQFNYYAQLIRMIK